MGPRRWCRQGLWNNIVGSVYARGGLVQRGRFGIEAAYGTRRIMARLDDQFPFIMLQGIWIAGGLNASEHRLRRGSVMFHVIVAQVARRRRGSVAGMSRTSGSRSIVVEGAEFGIGSLCAIGAGSAFVSVAFDLSL